MQTIHTPNGRVVGHVQGDTYHTNRKRSIHQLRQPPAWAIDYDILRQLADAGVLRVILRDVETATTFTARLSDFWRHGIALDRGHGRQIALPLAYWRVDGRQSLAEQQAERVEAKQAQMTLFADEALR